MRRSILLICLTALMISCSSNQTQGSDDQKVVTEATTTNTIDRYKLYPTQNVWTFLKLDTATGQIWQVQYSVKGEEYRFVTPLSIDKLNSGDLNGRYELYPTQNIYNFIMLDVINGNTYQVQWASEDTDRFVIPIK